MVSEDNSWRVYLLFMAAGLLVGATWASYQSESGSKVLTIALAACAAMALIGGLFWAFGAMNL